METISHRIPDILAGKTGFISKKTSSNQTTLPCEKPQLKYRQTVISIAQSQKTSFYSRFTKAFESTGFFNKNFPYYNNASSNFNRSTEALFNHAVKDNYPKTYIEYEKVFMSKGNLTPAQYAAAAPMENGNVYFNFTDNSNTGNAAATDKVILVAYAETLQQAVFAFDAGFRKNCEAILKTASFKGHAVETWIGFLSNDETYASDSVYTGRLQL